MNHDGYETPIGDDSNRKGPNSFEEADLHTLSDLEAFERTLEVERIYMLWQRCLAEGNSLAGQPVPLNIIEEE